jgi:RNase H-like domain found in reverse transcriptase
MSEALVLSMPNFSLSFVLEMDISDKGIGAVLMQGKRLHIYLLLKLWELKINKSPYMKNNL